MFKDVKSESMFITGYHPTTDLDPQKEFQETRFEPF